MNDKLVVLMIYGAVGLIFAVVIPLLGRKHLFVQPGYSESMSEEPNWIAICLILLAALTLTKLCRLLPWYYIIYGALVSGGAAVIVPKKRWQSGAAIFFGILTISVMPWWINREHQHINIDGKQTTVVFLILILVYWVLEGKYFNSVQYDRPLYKKIRILLYTLFFGLGSCFIFSTGICLASPETAGTLWHHWGAYIGPAQLISAGILPLRDVPLQYGLGPTMLIAVCGKHNYWEAMYWAASISTIAFVAVVSWIALQLNSSKHPFVVFVILAIIFSSSLMWTAYPPSLLAPIATPSTTGLRFLPGVLMLAWVVFQHKYRYAVNSNADLWGHTIWLTCILWAPEAGFHASAVWISYYVWYRTFSTNNGRIPRFVKAITTLLFAIFIGLFLSATIYRNTLGEWPLLSEYFAYLLHPPGPLPINPFGAIWFAVACLTSWGIGLFFVNKNTPERKIEQISWLIAIFGLATFSYYLGRSHDNNILNLMPYWAISLMATRAISSPGAIRAFATCLLAAILGWVPIFGDANLTATKEKGRLLEFTPFAFSNAFNRETDFSSLQILPLARTMNLHPEDATSAIKYIHNTFHEPVEVIDSFMLLDSGEEHSPWNALHGPANFFFIPPEKRRIYLALVSSRLKKTGWVLYEKSGNLNQLLLDYDSVYKRIAELNFGSYKAIRYAPQ